MKKKIMTIAAALTIAITPAMAQVFLTDEEESDGRVRYESGDFGGMVPSENVTFDQYDYAPVGEGLALLTGLGFVYLLGKRKKKE